MRRLLLLGIVSISAIAVLAQGKITPLNVKAGYWQNTTTNVVTGGLGIPPDMAAKLTPEQREKFEEAMKRQATGTPKTRTSKSCVTQKDLQTDPFQDKDQSGDMKCHENVIHSSGSDLEVVETCMDESSKSEIHMTFHAADSEHVSGNGTLSATMGGHTMNSNMKMDLKWLGATCPPGGDD